MILSLTGQTVQHPALHIPQTQPSAIQCFVDHDSSNIAAEENRKLASQALLAAEHVTDSRAVD